MINACDCVFGWNKGNCKQERETWCWDETVQSLVKQKTMEGVAERRQQRKIFGGGKESKIRCICCGKKGPGRKI